MSELIVCTCAAVRHLSERDAQEFSWLYLGKHLRLREQVACRLGEKRRIALGDRLHRAAESLRQPFLDFIADLGKIQTDRLGWWSSSCSWKDPGASDLFLLLCYAEIIEGLIRGRQEGGRPLVVVIEDRWLFRQLRETFAQDVGVEFHGRALLWPGQIRALGTGLVSRVIWLLRLVRNYVVQASHWRGEATGVPGQSVVALYSDPQPRCLVEPDEWADPYLGSLDLLLAEAGYSILRFSLPESGGLEEPIGRRRRYFRPLILYLSLCGALRAWVTTWKLTWPPRAEIGGRPIGWLLRREYWRDRWRSSHFLRRVFVQCIRRFFEVEKPAVVIFPYENQPWEKLLILEAQGQGISTLGYQHGAGMSRFRLSYFHGRGETEFAPMPDCIVSSGPYAHEILLADGTPKDRLIMGGSLRFQHVLQNGRQNPEASPAVGTPIRVLVALPIEQPMAEHLLAALQRAFPDGGLSEGMEFVIKPHPVHPVTGRSLTWPAEVVHGSIQEAMRDCPVLLYTGTSVGIEALAMGRRVVRYRSELLLDLDISAFASDEAIVDCGDDDLRTKLLMTVEGVAAEEPPRVQSAETVGRVFRPVDGEAWRQLVHRLAQKFLGRAPRSECGQAGLDRGKLKAVIFDLDGVLIESTEIKTRAFRLLFADHTTHLERIIAYHEANGGVSRFEKFRHIFADILKMPLPAERFDALCEQYAKLCLSEVLAAPLVAGAEGFLRDHHARLRLFVVSGTPEGELAEILRRRGLDRYFRGIFGSPATKFEIIRRILADWSLEPGEALFVGDSETDLLAAAETAVPFIGRVHAGSPASWNTTPGMATISDLTELPLRMERGGDGHRPVELVAS